MGFGGFCPLPIRLGSDWDASQHARLAADLTAAKRSAPLARLTFETSTNRVSILALNSVWGNRRGIIHVDWQDPVAYFAFDPSASDPYEQAHPVRIAGARVTLHGSRFRTSAVEVSDSRVKVLLMEDLDLVYGRATLSMYS